MPPSEEEAESRSAQGSETPLVISRNSVPSEPHGLNEKSFVLMATGLAAWPIALLGSNCAFRGSGGRDAPLITWPLGGLGGPCAAAGAGGSAGLGDMVGNHCRLLPST